MRLQSCLKSSLTLVFLFSLFPCLDARANSAAIESDRAAAFDVAPFALPHSPPGEIRFEETRDIVAVELNVDGPLPGTVGLSYLQQNWPGTDLERARDLTQPCQFGWTRVDDWFNGHWKRASTRVTRTASGHIRMEFEPLTRAFPERVDYDVRFRRTLGLRIEGVQADLIKHVRVFTRSATARTTLRVELNAGGRTPAGPFRFDGYNAIVRTVRPGVGCRLKEGATEHDKSGPASFELDVDHMTPSFRYSGDDGHVRFILGDDSFTISLASLKAQGPIWFAEKGVFITTSVDSTTSREYIARCTRMKTIAQRVRELPEQSYATAFLGQPRPHSAAWSLGFKNCRQRFWQDPNGDITLESTTVRQLPAADTKRYANDSHGRFFFGLEDWIVQGRGTDPAPALASTLRVRKDDIELEQTSLAAPLDGQIKSGPVVGDRDLVCLVRFRLRNVGAARQTARLPLEHSSSSSRSPNPYGHDRRSGALSDWLVPNSPREALSLEAGLLSGVWRGRKVPRARVETTMKGQPKETGLTFARDLDPGQSCDLVLKIPFVNLESPAELDQLRAIDFDATRAQLAAFWRKEGERGARIQTPVSQLDALYRSHLTNVQISDPAMPGEPELINTSVGTSTYSNCGNESCMINEELDQRGLVDDARRRLEVWLRFQGTEPLLGRYSDHKGVLHGAGRFSFAASYNQNHGWILWRLAEHALYTQDRAWFEHAAPALIAACDWVFRQRKLTMQSLPSSRGWERGFLPAGGLEDVQEYRYWLTSNAMIWRGVDTAARTLESFGHTEAARIRREADAYGNDLRRGFETMRQHCPLVRLRNGRWVPYYPSQLYRRGRDVGWIRETLEGSVYLLISGLYDPRGVEAQWILDDYQDNRYMSPPYGYAIVDEPNDWFSRGGLSIQPNLLAGLMPYLDRDEPEVYLWMFFNSWLACYREEINAMVEHPFPELGYGNTAHPKTSDEANAVMWLRYMFVYGNRDGLFLGRAIPRVWFGQSRPIGLENVLTRWGKVSVTYFPKEPDDTVRARVDLKLTSQPPRIVIRFREPAKRPIATVTINGREHKAFDASQQDVDLTGLNGSLDVVVRF
ncbi:MAG: hypothetical protein ACP5XB_02555 [Isosphaeraceae bacterium]